VTPSLAEMAPAYPRAGGWIQTYGGHQYWPVDPRSDEVHIEDIAHALSQLCRYGGHCRDFYSVAEHSWHVSHLVRPEVALQGLMHDATEAYCVDVPRPLKRFLSNYAPIEDLNWRAISHKFGLPYDPDPDVKLQDNRILLAEQLALMPGGRADWFPEGHGLTTPDTRIQGWGPKMAERRFLERFEELT